MRDSLIKDIKRYIAQETKASDYKVEQIYKYIFDQTVFQYGRDHLFEDLLDELDDLLSLFK